jgi:hypothetical protein
MNLVPYWLSAPALIFPDLRGLRFTGWQKMALTTTAALSPVGSRLRRRTDEVSPSHISRLWKQMSSSTTPEGVATSETFSLCVS